MPDPCHFEHLNCTMSEADLIPFLKALKKSAERKKAHKRKKRRRRRRRKKTWGNPYQPSIKHLENVISISSSPNFTTAFLTISQILNVLIMSSSISFYFYLFFCLSCRRYFFSLQFLLISSFECSCYVSEMDDVPFWWVLKWLINLTISLRYFVFFVSWVRVCVCVCVCLGGWKPLQFDYYGFSIRLSNLLLDLLLSDCAK